MVETRACPLIVPSATTGRAPSPCRRPPPRTIRPMRIVSIGGGPAGLYFAILMKQADRAHEILVVERNRADDTFGFGVVFSDATLEHFQAADRETHAAITRAFAHWNDIDTQYAGQTLRSTGHGFAGMSRQDRKSVV